MEMLEDTMNKMKEKLFIPASYQIVFTSSATECWEIIAQSLTLGQSYHYFNGAFGEKWCEYAHRIHGKSIAQPFPLEDQPLMVSVNHHSDDLLCFTHTETSNGAVIADETLSSARQNFKGLIAVDATSSMAGTDLPWKDADVWYASVQKCFGLPSGLGVMILSPAAVDRAYAIKENKHYNSLAFVIDNFRKFQTPYTPNILGIYLMNRLMGSVDPIDKISLHLKNRYLRLLKFIEEFGVSPLIKNPKSRSSTVMAIQDAKDQVSAIKRFASTKGIVLGNGYGPWKESTFRIANFPAIPDTEFDELEDCLREFWRKR